MASLAASVAKLIQPKSQTARGRPNRQSTITQSTILARGFRGRRGAPKSCRRAYNRTVGSDMGSLAEVLAAETREGELYDMLPDGRLRCYACGHCCPLPDGAIGVCKVRFNEGGTLRVPWGYVGGVQ